MRILFLTETVPWPLDSGGRIRTYHALRALSLEHEVCLHTFARSEEQRVAARDTLGSIVRSVHIHLLPRTWRRELWAACRSVIQRSPLTIARHYSSRVARLLASETRQSEFDIVYCDHLSMLQYGITLGLPVILDAHNVEYRIIERYASRLGPSLQQLVARREVRRLRDYEGRLYPTCRGILTVSAVDADVIRSMAGAEVPVIEVPIPIDVESIRPTTSLTKQPVILFVGPLDWPPNAEAVEWFVRHVWPLVLDSVPTALFRVVGRKPERLPEDVRRASRVRFEGWVPDVTPYFEQSRVLVVPIQSGSGLRVKILDAFARGIPVVTTPVGVEGIPANTGRHCLIASDAAEFSRDLVQVLGDEALSGGLAREARALVEQQFGTKYIGQSLRTAVELLTQVET